jgi:hypothetical protein
VARATAAARGHDNFVARGKKEAQEAEVQPARNVASRKKKKA